MELSLLRERVPRQKLAYAAFAAGYLLLALFFLKEYLLWNMPWLLALALLPLVAQVNRKAQSGHLLLCCAIAVAALAAYAQVTTLFFFAWVLGMWWSLGSMWGIGGLYPALLLLLGSPIFGYISGILSFPLRLQLSEWAAGLLRLVQLPAEAAGNVLLVKGEEFSVDPACAGLAMLSVSLLLAVFVLAHLRKSGGKSLPVSLVTLLLGFMVLLNVGCNLLRILLLVLFKVLPGNPMHDIMGLLCLLLYALLPFYLLARLCYSRFAVAQVPVEQTTPKATAGIKKLMLHLSLLLLLTGAGVAAGNKPAPVTQAEISAFTGFKKEPLADGVLKLTSPEALVYIKPIRSFYATEHHPFICWEGSGYLFRQVRELQVGSHTVYVGVLHHQNDKLYTAWWMTNGAHHTISQQDWRWRMFKGEAAFDMVNVTVATEAALVPAVERLLRQL